MQLKGIDISGWQPDIDVAKTDAAFVIVKATQGLGYLSSSFHSQAKATLNCGKLLGIYHYAEGDSSGAQEADFFVQAVQPYLGKALLVLDWEGEALDKGPAYAKAFLDRVESKTGVTPAIYTSKSVVRQYDWSSVAKTYPLWYAQYANNNPTGWQETPWTDSQGLGAWKSALMFQYTSSGRISGYSNNLDLDIFYGSKDDWKRWAGSNEPAKTLVDLADVAAKIHADMVNDERNGYSWSPRTGGDHPDGSKTLSINGRAYTYKLGSWDCSSSVCKAWQLALQGTPYEGKLDEATYTGNMRDVFSRSGLFDIWDTSKTSAERGDVYLNDAHHTAMCQSGANPDTLSEFRINEKGGVYGGQVGDQTGHESHIREFYEYPWNVTLHYNHKADYYADGQTTPLPTQPAAETVTWRVKQGGKWLAAGQPGDISKKIQAIAVDFHGHGWYQVKTAKHGWLGKVRGYDVSDVENGYAGYENSDILAVKAYYETPNPSQTGYFAAKYRVSDVGKDFWPYQIDVDTDNGQDGYAGNNIPISRFEIGLTKV